MLKIVSNFRMTLDGVYRKSTITQNDLKKKLFEHSSKVYIENSLCKILSNFFKIPIIPEKEGFELQAGDIIINIECKNGFLSFSQIDFEPFITKESLLETIF